MRPPQVLRRTLLAARLGVAAGVIGLSGVGCSCFRDNGFTACASCDRTTRALAESEGTPCPEELACGVKHDAGCGPGCLGCSGCSSRPAVIGTGAPPRGPHRCATGCPTGCGPGRPMRIVSAAVDAGFRAERAQRPDLALVHYQEALLNDPASADAHHRLAVLLDRSGDYAAAERHYVAALKARPGDADLLCDVGYSYLLQNRQDDAERQFRTALAERPDHTRSLENLALLYAKQNDRSRAAAVLAATGTKAETEAKLAALFPAGGAAPAGPSVESLPMWAGVSPDRSVTPASASSPADRSFDGGAVRTAAAGGPVGGISLLMDAPAEPARSLTPPVVPPPTAPAGDLPAWGGVAADPTPDLPAFAPLPAASPAEPAATAPAGGMPLWPPVGGFSAAG